MTKRLWQPPGDSDRCLSLETRESTTPLDKLPQELAVVAMKTLRSFTTIGWEEFQAQYAAQFLPTPSKKCPVYGIELARGDKDKVFGFVVVTARGSRNVAVLLDYRIMPI